LGFLGFSSVLRRIIKHAIQLNVFLLVLIIVILSNFNPLILYSILFSIDLSNGDEKAREKAENFLKCGSRQETLFLDAQFYQDELKKSQNYSVIEFINFGSFFITKIGNATSFE